MRRRRSIDTSAVVFVLLLFAGIDAGVAQPGATTAQPVSASGASLIEPDAQAALNRMGAYLRTLNSFYVTAETTIDEVTDEGEKLQFGGSVSLQALRPDKLRAALDSDRRERQLVYDGKTLTLYGPRVGYYATVPAPRTIRELLDLVEGKYGIRFPLADLFRWGADDAAPGTVTEAAVIGPAKIGDMMCDHVAAREKDIDWQVWIEQGAAPLPRKLVITTKSEPEQPQYVAVLHWKTNPQFDAATFTFVPPKGARKIPLRGDDAASGWK